MRTAGTGAARCTDGSSRGRAKRLPEKRALGRPHGGRIIVTQIRRRQHFDRVTLKRYTVFRLKCRVLTRIRETQAGMGILYGAAGRRARKHPAPGAEKVW